MDRMNRELHNDAVAAITKIDEWANVKIVPEVLLATNNLLESIQDA